MKENQQGPVETLCREIGIRFVSELERPEVLTAFVRVLHRRLEYVFWVNSQIDKNRVSPIDYGDARRALDKLADVLKADDPAALVNGAAEVHALQDTFRWQGNWASHVYDIVSSLASALRFGLDSIDGLTSRHAAAAARHLWEHEYGISKFDEYTGDWEKAWARAQFDEAIRRMAMSAFFSNDAPAVRSVIA